MPTATIDPAKVKQFWERRSEKLGAMPFESLVNFEEKPDLLELKTRLECECLLPLLPLTPEATVLDLGAGVGQWSFRFAERVRHVVAVEYAASLAAIGCAEARRRGLANIEYVVSGAEDYRASRPFDVVFASGFFMYLTEEQVSRLMVGLRGAVKPGGLVLLREPSSILPQRHQITDRWSEGLKAHYSAVYRSREEFLAVFAGAGFRLECDGQVFPEGSPLNKFPETRLRYYLFRPADAPAVVPG